MNYLERTSKKLGSSSGFGKAGGEAKKVKLRYHRALGGGVASMTPSPASKKISRNSGGEVSGNVAERSDRPRKLGLSRRMAGSAPAKANMPQRRSAMMPGSGRKMTREEHFFGALVGPAMKGLFGAAKSAFNPENRGKGWGHWLGQTALGGLKGAMGLKKGGKVARKKGGKVCKKR